MDFTEESTVAAFLLRARREGLRDFGACMAPTTAFHILQGIETLPLRMQRHVENTRRVVEFLAKHAAVERVAYPELESHPDHALAKRLLPKGCGAVFTLRDQGRAAGGAEVHRDAARLLAPRERRRREVAGDPSGDHDPLPDGRRRARRRRASAPGTIRLSIGLEDPEDLIEDLGRALAASQKG